MREIEMEGVSQNGERLLGDEGVELGFDNHDLDVEGPVLDIHGNGFDIEGNNLGIKGNVLHVDKNNVELRDGNAALEVNVIGGDKLESDGYDLEHDCEQMLNLEYISHDENGDDLRMTDGVSVGYPGRDYPSPVLGMAFESYDDAYNYYNCYARELGFAIRVKSSWTKRNSKEKRGAVLCCNCEGFKTIKEANSRRKETRTGCPAMIRLRLAECNKWKVDEVKLEHNHSFDHERAQNSKSHKKIDVGCKRNAEPSVNVEVRTIKLYRTATVYPLGCGSSNDFETIHHSDTTKRLNLGKGDAQIICNYFSEVQLSNPNFFYLMDLNDDGFLRNVFWIDSRSRAAYRYFSDVVLFDRTCLFNKFSVPLFTFMGINHHCQPILLGAGFLADETFENYIWLFRAWISCLLGRPPHTIISDHCNVLQSAIAEVFPRAHHRLNLSGIVQRIFQNLKALQDFESYQMVLNTVAFDSLKIDEFEMAWEDMIRRFGLADNKMLQTLYEDRERWAPVYSKDTFFAGISTFDKGESLMSFFDGLLHQQTSLKEFFDIYDLALKKSHQKEALDDSESRDSCPMLRTSSYYELQLSKIYTNGIFRKFQDEVVRMSSCLSITQLHANGPIVTYIVKEQKEAENLKDVRNFEVLYDKTGPEVRCICSCFNSKGYLCRHALCVLDYHRVEEIPFQYIWTRWRKDFKRVYVTDLGCNSIDVANPVQWFDHLHKRAMQVVEEGVVSQDHYMVAWQSFKESLNRVRLAASKHVK